MFPIIPANSATASFPENDEGIFGFGTTDTVWTNLTNLVSNAGVVSTDVAGVGTIRKQLAACEYGGDKGIFGYGAPGPPSYGATAITNLVSNTGVVATDTTGVGTIREGPAACRYDEDKGIFGYGTASSAAASVSVTNLVSNAGIVASDQAATTGTSRTDPAACEYGGDKGIFGFGRTGGGAVAITNLVSNAGVVASDQAATTGSTRYRLDACGYGGDKGIFGFGFLDAGPTTAITNLVSNAGVVATDTVGVGTARGGLAATQYGGDKGIFGFGLTGGSHSSTAITNLVSNAGVVASDQAATTGTVRSQTPGACSFN